MVAKSLHFCIIDLNTGIAIIIDLDTSGCLDFQIFQNQDCWAFLIIAAANFYNWVSRDIEHTIFDRHFGTVLDFETSCKLMSIQVQNCIKINHNCFSKIHIEVLLLKDNTFALIGNCLIELIFPIHFYCCSCDKEHQNSQKRFH